MKTFKHLALFGAFFATLALGPLSAGPQRLGAEDLAALQTKGVTAEDHLKLASHFQAEAEAFEQEAESHDAMAKRYNLPAKIASVKAGMAQHCVNLARTLREAAKEARQLAEGHRAMVDPAANPAAGGATVLWAAPERLGAEDLAALQMKGATAEDHLKLAAHFQAEAKAFEEEAGSHDAMAKRYNRPNLPPKIASLNTGMSRHCMNLSRTLKEAAKEAKLLADGHKGMADQAGK
jgi:hypothetical protein